MGEREAGIQHVALAVGKQALGQRRRVAVAPVREDDALGIARGAGGEDQLQRAVRVGGGNGQIERGQGRGGFPVDHIAPGRQGAIPLVRGEGQHPAQAGQACARSGCRWGSA